MTVRVGDRDVVYATTLLVPPGERGTVGFSVNTWSPSFEFSFVDDEDPNANPSINIERVDANSAKVVLRNFRNSLGLATSQPISVAELGTEKSALELMVWHARTGPVNLLTVQFLLVRKS